MAAAVAVIEDTSTDSSKDTSVDMSADTIVAIATPPGKGGIGIVRLSGTATPTIAAAILGQTPPPRLAVYRDFYHADGEVIDTGLALFFPKPHSYTAEHVLELQGHGSPVVLQLLVHRCLNLGARLARPGEFSERAYRNGRLDLLQAEAVADLIASGTIAAAHSAVKSLQGGFSARIQTLAEAVMQLRIFVEAAIDFPDEEIDFLHEHKVTERLARLDMDCTTLIALAKQGQLIRDGLKIVLTGLPNAGKSSLLNSLTDAPTAIVSTLPGTTRDVVAQYIDIDGLAVEIVDTAGIRDTINTIEAEGVRRANLAQQTADLILLVVDDATIEAAQLQTLCEQQTGPVLLVRNKIDLSGRAACAARRVDGDVDGTNEVALSALTGEGLTHLKAAIKQRAGYRQSEDCLFSARQRHLDALARAATSLQQASQHHAAQVSELLAAELSACHQALGEIIGTVTNDDLLGRIFSEFCIGK